MTRKLHLTNVTSLLKKPLNATWAPHLAPHPFLFTSSSSTTFFFNSSNKAASFIRQDKLNLADGEKGAFWTPCQRSSCHQQNCGRKKGRLALSTMCVLWRFFCCLVATMALFSLFIVAASLIITWSAEEINFRRGKLFWPPLFLYGFPILSREKQKWSGCSDPSIVCSTELQSIEQNAVRSREKLYYTSARFR